MEMKDLARVDLNLLVALETLLEERNVSKAADRLFITQSAMSKTLGRLRDLFDDPLFTRSANGMIPTPRALELATHLPQLLQSIQAMVQPAQFDPLTHEGLFRISLPDHIAYWLLPVLMQQMNKSAPKFRISAETADNNQLEQLALSQIDFAVHIARKSYPPEYRVMTMGFAPPVLFARKGHPLANKRVTWQMIAEYPQIRLFIADLINSQLVEQKNSLFIRHEQEVVPHLESNSLFTALEVVKATDYIFPGPPIFVEDEDLSPDLITLDIPEKEDVSLQFNIVYHERLAESPAHQFLFNEMMDIVNKYRVERGLPTLEDMRKLRNLEY